jgi:hypothetical protein
MFNLPFFLSTIIMGDNHVASSIFNESSC